MISTEVGRSASTADPYDARGLAALSAMSAELDILCVGRGPGRLVPEFTRAAGAHIERPIGLGRPDFVRRSQYTTVLATNTSWD